MDATLAWTVIGSGAGVAGVAVAVVALAAHTRSQKTSSKVTAELGNGQLAEDGVLYVEFASGKTNVMGLPKLGKARADAQDRQGKSVRHSREFSPVNAIFIRNEGETAVMVSRCHYLADLGNVSFRFEPQSAVSAGGDHLPKRLGPGEDAVLVHDLVSMRVFLNQVLVDHRVDAVTFTVVLTPRDGREVAVSPSIRVRADMSERELAASGLRLVRQELASPAAPPGRTMHGNRWSRRRSA